MRKVKQRKRDRSHRKPRNQVVKAVGLDPEIVLASDGSFHKLVRGLLVPIKLDGVGH